MNEPTDRLSSESPSPSTTELPDLPEPFASEPLKPRSGGGGGAGGCGKLALLGCGVLVVLFGIGMMVLMFKADDIMAWVFGKLEAEISQGLPEDLSPAERERLDDAFDAFVAAVRSGEADPAAMQQLQRELMSLSADIETGLTVEQVHELTEALEDAAGVGSDPEPTDEVEDPMAPAETARFRPDPFGSTALAA